MKQALAVRRDGTSAETVRVRLLTAGALAGPVFLTVLVAQMVTRDGFDITHHPLSLLTLGDAGWVQISNFIVAGALSLVLALGVRRTLISGAGSTWAARLLALYGVGLVAGGVFVPDPALGFPVGTPDRIPDSMSWHGALHAVAPPLAFVALIACCVVMARRFRVQGESGWATFSWSTAIVAFLLVAFPHQDTMSWRLALGVAVGFTWTTALAVLMRQVTPK